MHSPIKPHSAWGTYTGKEFTLAPSVVYASVLECAPERCLRIERALPSRLAPDPPPVDAGSRTIATVVPPLTSEGVQLHSCNKLYVDSVPEATTVIGEPVCSPWPVVSPGSGLPCCTATRSERQGSPEVKPSECPPMIRIPVTQRLRSALRHSFLRSLVVRYRHLGIEQGDMFLASYPKSGSTWLAFMIANLMTEECDDQKIADQRFLPGVGKQHEAKHRLPCGGRLIRTHEVWRPQYLRAIYVVRDGRDVAVSEYWHRRRVTGFEGDFSGFLEYWLRGYFTGAGAWAKHIEGWLTSPSNRNGEVLLVRYEDLKQDTVGELRRVADFLGLESSDERITSAVQASTLEKMKKQEERSEGIKHREKDEKIPVVRKGNVGDWRNHFSDSDIERFSEHAGGAMSRLGYESATSLQPE